MLYDKDIREPLFEYFEEMFGKIRVIEEKQIFKSRADAMIITENFLVGVEIKSDADTYVRLEKQVKNYNRIFDYNFVAVGASHAHHIKEHVPEYWGIITIEEVDGKVDFYLYRAAQPNPKREKAVKFRNQLSILWRNELLNIQLRHGLHKYPGKSKRFIWDYLMEKIPEDELKKELIEELFERDYTIYREES